MMLYQHTTRGLIISDAIIAKISQVNQLLLLRPTLLQDEDMHHETLSSDTPSIRSRRRSYRENKTAYATTSTVRNRETFFSTSDIDFAILMIQDVQESLVSFDPTLAQDMKPRTNAVISALNELREPLDTFYRAHEYGDIISDGAYEFDHAAIDAQHSLSELVTGLHNYDQLMFPEETAPLMSDSNGIQLAQYYKSTKLDESQLTVEPDEPGISIMWHAHDFTWSCLVRYDDMNRYPDHFSISFKDMLIPEQIYTFHFTPREAMQLRKVLFNAIAAYKSQTWGDENTDLTKAELEFGGTSMTFRAGLSQLSVTGPPDHRQVFCLSSSGREDHNTPPNMRDGHVIDIAVTQLSTLRNLIWVLCTTHPDHSPALLPYGQQYTI